MGAVATRRLTEKQDKFVELVASGIPRTDAARTVGFAHPEQDSYRLSRLPHIVSEIVTRRAIMIEVDGGTLAFQTLKDCCSEKYSGTVRVAAASRLAQMAGMVKPDSAIADKRDMQDMTPQELADQLAKIDAALLSLGRDAKPASAQIITQEPDNAGV